MAKRLASVFSQPFQRRPSGRLLPANFRDFSGGLNVVDDDELLNTKFAKVLQNFHRGTDGSLCLRFGTFWYADVKSHVTGTIVDGTYFREKLIFVTTTGQVCTVDDNGVVAVIWNSALAAALPGAPAGWSATTQVTFVHFSDLLIIHNGIDKPIKISIAYITNYLGDPAAANSNVWVPIGKYACTVASYHCVAGIVANPALVSISAAKSPGTFLGATAPNDAIEILVGAYAPAESTEIFGIAGYRSFLIVFFRLDAIVFQLGIYDSTGAVHTPKFSDTLPHFGLTSQRSIVPVENDMLFAAPTGVGSVKRNLLAGLIESQPLSSLINPRYMHELRDETVAILQRESFAVHNEISGRGTTQAMFFNPNGTCFVYTFSPELRIKAWSEYIGWEWAVSACQSAKGRIFLTEGTKVFQHGNDIYDGEDVKADKLNDHSANWANSIAYTVGQLIYDTVELTSYRCLVAHTSDAAGTFAQSRANFPDNWEQYLGEPINFLWELPWFDARHPMHVKHSKYIRMGSKGSARFTVEAYADDLFRDINDDIVYDPGLSIEMVANQFPGWGEPGEDIEFGGGRPSNYPKLLSYPIKFTRLKLRIHGSTRSSVRFLWMMLMYKLGSLHR